MLVELEIDEDNDVKPGDCSTGGCDGTGGAGGGYEGMGGGANDGTGGGGFAGTGGGTGGGALEGAGAVAAADDLLDNHDEKPVAWG